MKMNNESATEQENKELEPEHIESTLNKREFETRHLWRQYGNYIICESCPFRHATFIGNDKLLERFDENGQPIFKKIEISK